MTIEIEAPRAPVPARPTPRSSVAVADVELARHTLAALLEPQPFEEAGERMLARIRRLVGRDEQN